MVPNKGSEVLSPEFWDTIYTSDVSGASKVKSDAQIYMNNNSYPVQNFFIRGGWADSAQAQFLNFWHCPEQVQLENSYSGSSQ